MRAITFIVALTCSTIATAAQADVSDNLVFCSQLSVSRERIACYDAAARIAENHPSASHRKAALVTAPAADKSAGPVYSPVIEKSHFNGAYATIGGSYGISSQRNVIIGSPLADSVSAQGWSARTTLGYNATISNFLFGVELSGRYGKESATTSLAGTNSGFPIFGQYSIENDTGVHIAGRAGLFFDNTLVFVKGGIGVSHMHESALSDTSAFFFGSRLTGNRTRWLPSAIVGAGIEQNFGRVFVRAEGELEAVSLPAG